MENVGTMCEGAWAGFGGIFTAEETNFMAEYINDNPFPCELSGGGESSETSSHLYYNCQDNSYTNFSYFPRETGYDRDTRMIHRSGGEEHYYPNNFSPVMNNHNSFNPMEFCMVEDRQNPNKALSGNVVEEVDFLKGEMSNHSMGDSQGSASVDQKLQSKRKYELPTAIENHVLSENPKKKPRVSGNVGKTKRNIQSKNQGTDGQSSSSNNSIEDTNVHQELSGLETSDSRQSEPVGFKGKTRAGRGSATDPQSLYARKRRERINERLRILQTLVPNGTKVDISTMLEEAVQYVKFLQVQIKLLSSDELWKYAPLAYNGMDIGIDLKISLPQ